MNRRLPLVAILLAGLTLAPDRACGQATHADMLLFSTMARGGTLTVDYDFSTPTEVFESICVADRCLYGNTNPGFNVAASDRPAQGFFLLRDRTQVTMEIVALDPGVSVKVGSSVLNSAGARATIGTAPGIHLHPSWQVAVQRGQRGTFKVRFRLTTTSRFYEPSEVFVLSLSNGSREPTPTETQAPSPSASPSPSPSASMAPTPTNGATASPSTTPSPTITPLPIPSATPTVVGLAGCDANCDGAVSGADFVAAVASLGRPSTACGVDPIADGALDARDVDAVLACAFIERDERDPS
ncbi:hypothetical protein L6Q96_01670 [Candidatus Binatia bacterium]|nr:hypothetical protein [Candidatus Binatia bacterium]